MPKSVVTIDSLLTAAGEAMRRSEATQDRIRKQKEEDRAYLWAKQAIERIEMRRRQRKELDDLES